MVRLEQDIEYCAQRIRTGSYSFHAASCLLPQSIRDPARILYAFCRVADDEVDEGSEKAVAVLNLADRLERVYAGRPDNRPEDRAMAHIVDAFELPISLPEALLEGLAWDAKGLQYKNFSGVVDYSARVAASVGVMMCVLMRSRDPDVLARACDLGVAMQLTNIARDVGEDARAGRLYLPHSWLKDEGVCPEKFVQSPLYDEALARIVKRLLSRATQLYLRSQAGIDALPWKGRTAIWAARFIYAGIGRSLQNLQYNSIHHRARTTSWEKIGWLGLSVGRAGLGICMPRAATLHAKPLQEVKFLIDAAALPGRDPSRHAKVMDILLDLAVQKNNVPWSPA